VPYICRYFQDYARHFNLYPYITFNTEVLTTERDEERKKWLVTMKSRGDGKITTREFDKIVLAQGFEHAPKKPKFEGQEQFEGPIIHSQEYKSSVSHHSRVFAIGFFADETLA
jgi:dimethylaniline monooxygenase (N-oxide forming)